MRVIVIGASGGGINALKVVASGLPVSLDAAVLVVLHVAASSPGVLPDILSRAGRLPSAHGRAGQSLARGRIYVASPDFHMLIDGQGRIQLSHGPKENHTRPAIDPLFRSAAMTFGPEVIGVVLTGNLNDGTAGLLSIKDAGGIAVVQDPVEAEAPGMPASATRHVAVDYCVPLAQMAPLLVRLTQSERSKERRIMPDRDRIETEIALGDEPLSGGVQQIGDATLLTCPECHGTLLRIRDHRLTRFRCHTGHAFTAQSLEAALDQATEEAIWSTVRSFHEGAMLLEHLATHAREAGRTDEAQVLLEKAHDKLRRAETVRKTAVQNNPSDKW